LYCKYNDFLLFLLFVFDIFLHPLDIQSLDLETAELSHDEAGSGTK